MSIGVDLSQGIADQTLYLQFFYRDPNSGSVANLSTCLGVYIQP